MNRFRMILAILTISLAPALVCAQGGVSPVAFGAKFDTNAIGDATWAASSNSISTPATSVLATTIVSGGTGYVVNDVLAIPAGSGATIKVTSVTGGVITGTTVLTGGIGYLSTFFTPYTPIAVTGGTGTGAIFFVNVSSDAPFNASTDIGKNIFGTCRNTDFFILRDVPLGTITAVADQQHVTISSTTANSCAGMGTLKWGTDDTAALRAWAATMPCLQQQNEQRDASPRFVMPVGGTMFHQRIFEGNSICGGVGSGSGGSLVGAGMNSTYLFPMPNFSPVGMVPNGTSGLFFDSMQSFGLAELGGFTIDGDGINFSAVFGFNSGVALQIGGGTSYVHDIEVFSFDTFEGALWFEGPSNLVAQNLWVLNNEIGAGCGVEVYSHAQQVTKIGGASSNNGSAGLCVANSNNNLAIPTHMTVTGWLKDEDGVSTGIVVQNSVNLTFIGVSSYTQTSVDGTSEVWFKNSHISDFNGDTPNFTSLTIATGGKVHAEGSTFLGRGTGHAVNNSGSFFDEGGPNLLTGPVPTFTGSGAVFGSSSATGTTQSSAHIAVTLAGGFGAAATVDQVAGSSLTEQFRVNASGVTGANPQITITFPTPFFAAPLCSAQQVGGTGTINTITTSAVTTTSCTLTWNGTPATGHTYIIQVSASL